MHVVRRDHHEVGFFEGTRLAVAVGPRAAQHRSDLARDALGFFGRGGHVADVVHGQEAQPGAERGPLSREAREAVEPVTVHDLRDEPADVRMHAPRAVEEDPLVRGHGQMVAEQVLEHADVLRVSPLGDLGELRRIAEQDQVARGGAHGEGVGEGHLPGLVDDERVDEGAIEVLVQSVGYSVSARSASETVRYALTCHRLIDMAGIKAAALQDVPRYFASTLQKCTELIFGQSCVAHDTTHRKCIHGVVSRNGDDPDTVGHHDVLALPHDAKACSL